MEALHNLLFELAGEDRLDLLYELKNKPIRMSDLSKKLGFTVQETSRNLSRLVDSKLINKEADGCFRLTPFGEETLTLLKGFDFLSRHREYFLTHTLMSIPKEFSSSLALLEGCEPVNDVMAMFANVENMIRIAKEYVFILSNQVLVSTLPLLKEAIKKEVEFRLILPASIVPPKDALERMNDPIFIQALRTGKFQNRNLERIEVLICLSEIEVAALCFSNSDGKLDYLGFHATDQSSLKWTKALFLHYWNNANRIEPDSSLG